MDIWRGENLNPIKFKADLFNKGSIIGSDGMEFKVPGCHSLPAGGSPPPKPCLPLLNFELNQRLLSSAFQFLALHENMNEAPAVHQIYENILPKPLCCSVWFRILEKSWD